MSLSRLSVPLGAVARRARKASLCRCSTGPGTGPSGPSIEAPAKSRILDMDWWSHSAANPSGIIVDEDILQFSGGVGDVLVTSMVTGGRIMVDMAIFRIRI